jgi:hypothetical protein
LSDSLPAGFSSLQGRKSGRLSGERANNKSGTRPPPAGWLVYLGQRLIILAVKELAHGLPPSLVRFTQSLALVGVHAALSDGESWFGATALWATVGESGFVGLQLEFFRADGADFDGESHLRSIIRRLWRPKEVGHRPATDSSAFIALGVLPP